MSPLPELNKELPIAVLAAGRLGSSLAIALSKADYNVAAVTSRQSSHRKWLGEQIPNTIVVENVQTAANVASIVFITGPDAHIEARQQESGIVGNVIGMVVCQEQTIHVCQFHAGLVQFESCRITAIKHEMLVPKGDDR